MHGCQSDSENTHEDNRCPEDEPVEDRSISL